jgi:signal transduction histidine kinase/ligand-binding sensor domain-containing protein
LKSENAILLTVKWLNIPLNLLKYFILIGLLFIAIINTYSEQKIMQFKHLGTDEGLSSTKIKCAFQDYKGFMWIGTNNGLNKYNGGTFVVYKNHPAAPGNILGNFISTIFEDHNKNLLFGTDAGLSTYNRDLDQFINFKDEKSSALYQNEITINSIAEDSIGNLWLATKTGLIYFNRISNKITTYKHDSLNHSSISLNSVLSVYIDKIGRIWVGTNKGLNLFNSISKTFVHIEKCIDHNETISDLSFLDITEDKAGNIWFGSSNGLFCLQKNAKPEKYGLIHYIHNTNDQSSISKGRIPVVFSDYEGNLWIGGGGLFLFNKTQNKFSRFGVDDFNPMGLNNESITGIAKDKNHNLWVCTRGGGVNISVKNSGFILQYKKLPGAPESLSSNTVSCFYEDPSNKIWVGTDGGGLNLFDKKTGKFSRYNTTNSKLSSNAVLCMVEGNENQIWMGTWGGGLVSFNTKTKIFRPITKENSLIPDNSLYSIAKDSIGNLWIGSFEKGLIYYNVKENSFKSYSSENSKILNNQINIVKIDRKGNIYMGSSKSFQIYVPSKNKFISFKNNLTDPKTISSLGIFDIFIENDTSIWIATVNGLNRYNHQSGLFKKYFQSNGLPHSTIKAITIDKSGVLWVTTLNGLCRFDYKKNTFRNYTKSDGLQDNEFYERSIVTDKKGKIFVGGINGFNIIFPELIATNKTVPNIVITDFHIFNEKVKIGETGSSLKKQISETKEITLSYKQSVLTFYFAAMDFTNPQKNKYAYKMENFDANWTYCGNRMDATYTNLNPGNYIFHVKGSNDDDVWNETGTTLKITITPPWWETKIAIASFVLLVISLFLGIYIFRVMQLNNQKLLLEELVKVRTEELDNRNVELANKNEEIRTQAEVVFEANKLLKEHQIIIEQKNLMLIKQAEQLNETNTLLVERQDEIEDKNITLVEQAEALNETNNLLKERQVKIEKQSAELKAQKEELQQQRDNLNDLNVTKDKLFSILGHDLRTPFNTILGYSDLLYNNCNKYSLDKIRTHIGYIKDTARNTFYLLNNLLDWARSQQGTIHIEPEEIQITEILATEIRILQQQADSKKVKLKLSAIGDELVIEADPNILSTVMRNLISNAIKFSQKNKKIEIALHFQPNNFTFSVKDEGLGMSPEKVKTLFNVSTNTSTRGTEGEKGTGLGLLLCADFIAKHKGRIWVESEEGKGSTFSFTIPVKQ